MNMFQFLTPLQMALIAMPAFVFVLIVLSARIGGLLADFTYMISSYALIISFTAMSRLWHYMRMDSKALDTTRLHIS